MSSNAEKPNKTFPEKKGVYSCDDLLHYIYNIYNNKNRKDNSREDRKILRSLYVSALLWDSAKYYAHFLQISTSVLVEKALMEYMVGHASELPVTATFNLVPIPERPKLCGYRNCENPTIASGIWRGEKEFLLCKKHLAEAEGKPNEWKVVSHG